MDVETLRRASQPSGHLESRAKHNTKKTKKTAEDQNNKEMRSATSATYTKKAGRAGLADGAFAKLEGPKPERNVSNLNKKLDKGGA
jgi:hypothetical protein